MLRKFWVSGTRWGRILSESEERIEKFVDTAENEPRQNLRFLRCLWGSFSFSKIAFSKWHFFDAGRAESRPIYSSGVSEWVPKVSGRLVDLCQANQKKWFFHIFYSSLGIRLCKVSWRVLARAARHFGDAKTARFCADLAGIASGMCRGRRAVSRTISIAQKFVDTAENEILKVWLVSLFEKMHFQ